jgi:hypothetical protein
MQWRNQNPRSNKPPWSPEDVRQAVWFWIFWSIYVGLAAFLITALLTDWPSFLHNAPHYFR